MFSGNAWRKARFRGRTGLKHAKKQAAKHTHGARDLKGKKSRRLKVRGFNERREQTRGAAFETREDPKLGAYLFEARVKLRRGLMRGGTLRADRRRKLRERR